MQSVASASVTSLNFLQLLGVDAAIKVLDMSYVTSPCLMRLAECGAIRHIRSVNGAGDYETSDAWLAATSAVQLVLTDSYGTGGTGGPADVDVDASFDPGILNRGEWIKFVALFFNAEAAANAYFAGVVTNVTSQTTAAVAASAASATLNGAARPLVAFASYSTWGPEWYLSNASYKAQYVAAANGLLAAMPAVGAGVTYKTWTNPPTTAAFSSAAAARAALKGVTVLIDETAVWPGSPETYTMGTFMANYGFSAADAASGVYPFLSNGRVFREDKAITDGEWGKFGTDWLANSVSEPQTVLSDFLTVLYPSASAPGTTWLRNLAAAEPFQVRTSAQCAGAEAATVATICGGPSTTFTLFGLRPANFTAPALEAAVLALLPSGTTAAVTVSDFAVGTTLHLSGPSANFSLLQAAGGTASFLGALGVVLGHPVTSSVTSFSAFGRRRSLFAATTMLSVPIEVDSFGIGGGPACASVVATLQNATALLAAVQAAGAAGATSASVDAITVSATVSLTVRGGDTAAAMATLTAAAASGKLNNALAVSGMADPVASAATAGRTQTAVVALMIATWALLA